MPFVDLAPLEAMNDDMRELQDRRACNMAVNRLRGIHTRKSEMPAIVSLFNKVVNKKGPVVKKLQASRIKKVAEKFQGTGQNGYSKRDSVSGRSKSSAEKTKQNDNKQP